MELIAEIVDQVLDESDILDRLDQAVVEMETSGPAITDVFNKPPRRKRR